MSVWAHLAGTIRMDGFHTKLDEDDWSAPQDPPVSLGVMTIDYQFPYDSTEEEREREYMERSRNWEEALASGIPMGSEGSLRWDWVAARKKGDIQWGGAYMIEGDLRDFESIEPIEIWLRSLLEKFDNTEGVFVRQLNLQVHIEGKPPYFFALEYDEKLKKEVLVKYQSTKNGALLYAP